MLLVLRRQDVLSVLYPHGENVKSSKAGKSLSEAHRVLLVYRGTLGHDPSLHFLCFLVSTWHVPVEAYHMSWLATFANHRASMCRNDRT